MYPAVFHYPSLTKHETISHLPLKTSMHLITGVLKHADLTGSLHFAQFKKQQTELRVASWKYWCVCNLWTKAKTAEFNWQADRQNTPRRTAAALIHFHLQHSVSICVLWTSDRSSTPYDDVSAANERYMNVMLRQQFNHVTVKLYCCFSQVLSPDSGRYQTKQRS